MCKLILADNINQNADECNLILCELTSTREDLVDGADINPAGGGLAVGCRDQPEDGHFCVELLGPGLSELTCLTIPASPLQEEPMDVAAHVWFVSYL